MIAMNIAWCMTGGGADIRSITNLIKIIKDTYRINVTLFLTRWGYEVARIFGVLDILKSIARGGYYQEFLVEEQGMFYIGRMNMRKYNFLVIAPATTNTIAKIVLGIADNIASALYSQATKSSIPTIIFPTDIPNREGFIEAESPCYIDKTKCNISVCSKCFAQEICPVNAITFIDSFVRIDLSKCIGCERCIYSCPIGAVRCWEKIRLLPREMDIENIEKLKKLPYTFVVGNIKELENIIKKLIQDLIK